jgi:hypothetical protein
MRHCLSLVSLGVLDVFVAGLQQHQGTLNVTE